MRFKRKKKRKWRQRYGGAYKKIQKVFQEEIVEEKEKQKRSAIYYRCNKLGYYKQDCPVRKRNLKKTKKSNMMPIWRYSNNLSLHKEEKEEGIANPCLMAYNDEINIENSFKFTFQELLEAFYKIMDNFKKIKLKNN